MPDWGDFTRWARGKGPEAKPAAHTPEAIGELPAAYEAFSLEEWITALQGLKEQGNDAVYQQRYQDFIARYGQQAETILRERQMRPKIAMTSAEEAAWQSERRFAQAEALKFQQLGDIEGMGPARTQEAVDMLIRQQVDPLAAGMGRRTEGMRESMAARGMGRSGAMLGYEQLLADELARETGAIGRRETASAEEMNRMAEWDRLMATGGVRQQLGEQYLGQEFQIPESGGQVPWTPYPGTTTSVPTTPLAEGPVEAAPGTLYKKPLKKKPGAPLTFTSPTAGGGA